MANAQVKYDSAAIFFASGAYRLTSAQEKRLDGLLQHDRFSGILTITGYADHPGTSRANRQMALRRAESVKDWLLRTGISPDSIQSCSSGLPVHKGRVDIISGSDHRAAPTPAAGLKNLTSLKPNETLELNNLYFQPGMAIMLPSARVTLDTLTQVLAHNPGLRIAIEGHICCGADTTKFALKMNPDFAVSEARAKAVFDFLISQGISAERLSYKGFGFSRPRVYPERNEADMEKNRRVEIRVVSTAGNN